jgi:hypothetical protein
MISAQPLWLLLVASLPASGATPRMRLWRATKSLGCVSLRDGAYLLPNINDHAHMLAELAEQTNYDGGQAWVLGIHPYPDEKDTGFETLFDRTAEFSEWETAAQQTIKEFASQSPVEVSRSVKRLQKYLDQLRRIDFFPNDASIAALAAWTDLTKASSRLMSSGEPSADERAIEVLDKQDYQGRLWATRQHLWVDRVASAWLIQRFIDASARFLWLDNPGACPPTAVGFDFDGATFTHIDDKVTFEVLMASFGLDADAGLVKIAALVNYLDAGGPATPDAGGFEAILSGTRSRLNDDDSLLAEIGKVFDSLHAHYRIGKHHA